MESSDMECSHDHLIKAFKNSERSNEERENDLATALSWLSKELQSLKTSDKMLMMQFQQLRKDINELKDFQYRGSSISPSISEEPTNQQVDLEVSGVDPFDESTSEVIVEKNEE